LNTSGIVDRVERSQKMAALMRAYAMAMTL
jgi:hypothetical protein